MTVAKKTNEIILKSDSNPNNKILYKQFHQNSSVNIAKAMTTKLQIVKNYRKNAKKKQN